MSGTPSANVISVDPSPVFHAGIRDYLAHGGHRVVGELQDPAEALQPLNMLHPDLAIIGPHFAEHESLAVCRDLVAQQPDLKVSLISEHWAGCIRNWNWWGDERRMLLIPKSWLFPTWTGNPAWAPSNYQATLWIY